MGLDEKLSYTVRAVAAHVHEERYDGIVTSGASGILTLPLLEQDGKVNVEMSLCLQFMI